MARTTKLLQELKSHTYIMLSIIVVYTHYQIINHVFLGLTLLTIWTWFLRYQCIIYIYIIMYLAKF